MQTPEKPLDVPMIRRALQAYVGGTVFEIRALNAALNTQPKTYTLSGYFDDVDAAVQEIGKIHRASGVYFTLNPVNPPLLARSYNRIKIAERGGTTSDSDILKIRYVPIDIDPVRPAGVSSTEEQHMAALECSSAVRRHMATKGWHAPFATDSGNGAHLLYQVDQPLSYSATVKGILEMLARRFNTPEMKVDVAVYNPARIWKVPGTWACKGDNIPKYPHRIAIACAWGDAT